MRTIFDLLYMFRGPSKENYGYNTDVSQQEMLRHFPIGSVCQSSSCGCVRLADLQKMLSLRSI